MILLENVPQLDSSRELYPTESGWRLYNDNLQCDMEIIHPFGPEVLAKRNTVSKIHGEPMHQHTLHDQGNINPLVSDSATIVTTMSPNNAQREMLSVPDEITPPDVKKARKKVPARQQSPPPPQRTTCECPGASMVPIFSPNAPQVEHYVDATEILFKVMIQVSPRVEKAENSKIRKFMEDMVKHNGPWLNETASDLRPGTTSPSSQPSKKLRVPASSAARKLITDLQGRSEPRPHLSLETIHARGPDLITKTHDDTVEILLPRHGTSSSTLGSATSSFTTTS